MAIIEQDTGRRASCHHVGRCQDEADVKARSCHMISFLRNKLPTEAAFLVYTVRVLTQFGLRDQFHGSEVTHPGTTPPLFPHVNPQEPLAAEISVYVVLSQLSSLCLPPSKEYCHFLWNTQGLNTVIRDQLLHQ